MSPFFTVRRRLVASALFCLAVLLLLALWLWNLEMDLLQFLNEARATPHLLLASAVIYALVLAVPFMPGMELGLLLMMVFGPQGALAAWLATIAGLLLAYFAGRLARRYFAQHPALLPWRDRAAAMASGEPLPAMPGWQAGLLRLVGRKGGVYDYVIIGLLLNLPGNIVLGGGGGIALLSALSGRVHWPGFAVTVVLATCLLPTLAWLGLIDLERWLLALA